MKYKETMEVRGYGGFGHTESRVIDVPDGTEPPEGAVKVPDETPASDWARDN